MNFNKGLFPLLDNLVKLSLASHFKVFFVGIYSKVVVIVADSINRLCFCFGVKIMNIRFDLSNPLFANLSTNNTQNISQAEAVNNHDVKAHNLSFEKTHSDQQHTVKQVLKGALEAHSPKELSKTSASATDSRAQMYQQSSARGQEVYEGFIDKVTRRVNSGKAQGESAGQLNALLERISQGSEDAHSETRNILSGLSQLDASTESYISKSQTYTRLGLDELSSKIGVDEQFADASENQKEFSLQVTTREGDEITISIKQSKDVFNATRASDMSVSYEVEGELSESEHEALGELMNAIGSTSDSLLAGSDLGQLMGINEFNGGVLSSFSLSLDGSDQQIEYSYNHDNNNQQLQGSWVQDNQVMAEFNLDSKIGGVTDPQQLEQYLQLIDEAASTTGDLDDRQEEKAMTQDLYKNTLSSFMGLADRLGSSIEVADKKFDQARQLAGSLFEKMTEEQSSRLGLDQEDKAKLNEGFNLMADFSASFDSKSLAGFQVDLMQQTHTDGGGGLSGSEQTVTQTVSVNLHSVMSDGENSREQKLKEDYTVSMEIDEYQMQSMAQSRDVKNTVSEKEVIGDKKYRFEVTEDETHAKNTLNMLDNLIVETSNLSGQKTVTEGIVDDGKLLSSEQSTQDYNYNEQLISSSVNNFKEANEIAISTESLKKILDEVLDIDK